MNFGARDRLMLVILAAVLLIGAVLTVLISPLTPIPNSQSADEDGALALRLWLENSGFTVQTGLSIPADLDQTEVLFVLQPQYAYSQADAQTVREWVEAGHNLVMAGSSYSINALAQAFDLSMDALPNFSDGLTLGSPILLAPPVNDSVPGTVSYGFTSDRSDVVPYLFRGSTAVLVSFEQGLGLVWASGVTYPFSNRGLHDEQNARLIQNIIAGFPAGARVAFDDGLHTDEESLNEWLFNSTPGRGLLLTGALIFLFLAAQGRRFGKPIPLPDEKLSREPVEHIQAIAYLFRRAGGRDQMLIHMQARFRRYLSRRYGLDPRLPDAELIEQAVYRDPSLEEARIRDLLTRLGQRQVSEAALVQIAHDVDSWLGKLH